MTWQRIETAPKTSEHVLLWDRIVGVLQGWRDMDNRWCHSWDSDYIPRPEDLTHWQPLPPPPRDEEAGG